MTIALLIALAGLQAQPCTEVVRVLEPCDGQLLPHADAAALLTCRDVSLPGCHEQAANAAEQAALAAADLRAELAAAKAWAAAQASRADSLGALLDSAVTPPTPAPEWWQSSAWVVTISLLAVGALTAAVLLAVVG